MTNQTLTALRMAVKETEKEMASRELSSKVSAVVKLDYIYCIFNKCVSDPKFEASARQIKSLQKVFADRIEEINFLRASLGLEIEEFDLDNDVGAIISNLEKIYEDIRLYKRQFKILSPIWFDLYTELGF